ncbi:MAG TPA: hypothetical protein VHM19_07610, partial [Polyangiales bacterium]|nr:hypothetical protein [Polyangiales bacterium]
ANRCESCLQRDPAAAAPPIPWETPTSGSFVQRYLGTLSGAFRPVLTAPAFAQPELRAARRFFAVSTLPLAALAGIMPLTRTLEFRRSFEIVVQSKADGAAIALDVGLAMLTQVGWSMIAFLALALPFTSLVRAYGSEARRPAALRVLLYRFWLSPAAFLFYGLATWALPGPANAAPDAPPAFLDLVVFVDFFMHALLFVSMRSTARLACGVGALLSYVITVVPVIMWCVVELLLSRALMPGAIPAS